MIALAAFLRAAESIRWLTVRDYAGWIGFGLLAISFALQLLSASIEAFHLTLPGLEIVK